MNLQLDDETFHVLHELVLRGLRETDPARREYGEAYDDFVDAADIPRRIGDQPDRVREVWQELIEDGPTDGLARGREDAVMKGVGMEVDPPAARVCRRCGHPEKVEHLPLVEKRWSCSECGYRRYSVDDWERVVEEEES